MRDQHICNYLITHFNKNTKSACTRYSTKATRRDHRISFSQWKYFGIISLISPVQRNLADEIIAQHYIDSGESIFFRDNQPMPIHRENLRIRCNNSLISSKNSRKLNLKLKQLQLKKTKFINDSKFKYLILS